MRVELPMAPPAPKPRVVFYAGLAVIAAFLLLADENLISSAQSLRPIITCLQKINAIEILSSKSLFPASLSICVGLAIVLAPIVVAGMIAAGMDRNILRNLYHQKTGGASKVFAVLFMLVILGFPWIFGSLENEYLVSSHLFLLVATNRLALLIYALAIFISNVYCWAVLVSMLILNRR